MQLPMPRWLPLSVAVLAAIPASAAAHEESRSAPRLLNREQGRAVVRAASEGRAHISKKPDCSHLVHHVYELAGFPYPYASSLDLYEGVESFRRVTAPHAGDLVVWRGHVGIVMDPKQNSFYSSVSSGLRTEHYDEAYWRARGRPRFYRYILPSAGTLVAAGTIAKVSQPPPHIVTAPARRATAAAPEPETPSTAGSESEPAAGSATAAVSTAPSLEPPSSILVASAADRPTVDEIEEAVSELNNAAGNVLRNVTPGNTSRTVLIYDELKVERLEIKRDRGWAHVEIEGRVSIAEEKLQRKHRREKLRWELRRTSQGWRLLAPPDRVYVPRDVAVRVLANRLALLTENEAASDNSEPSLQQQARIVQTLGFLYEQ